MKKIFKGLALGFCLILIFGSSFPRLFFKGQLNSFLENALLSGDTSQIRIALFLGADANFVNSDGDTPLHLALGMVEIPSLKRVIISTTVIETLLGYGANPNSIRFCDGRTPLHLACSDALALGDVNSEEKIRVLLKAGANTKIKDKSGVTALDYVCRSAPNWSPEILMELKSASSVTR